MTSTYRHDPAFLKAVETLIQTIQFDVNGTAGKGGNGGLTSDKAIRQSGELNIMMDRIKKEEATASAQEPVAYLRQGEPVPVQNVPFGAMWISDKNDPRSFPVYASPCSISCPVAWYWEDATGCFHITLDRADVAEAAKTVGCTPKPLFAGPGDTSRFFEQPAPSVVAEVLLDGVWNAAVEQAAVIANDCVHLTPDPGEAIKTMMNGRAKLHPASQSALSAQVQDVEKSGLTISELQSAHVDRQEEWCSDVKPDLSFRGNELGGECGEAQNVIKKLERERHGWRGSRDTVEHLGEELADVVHCATLVAITAGIDLQQAVIDKFNDTSAKNSLSTVLKAEIVGVA